MSRFGTIIVFTLIGPPIGSLLFGIFFNAFAMVTDEFKNDMWAMLILAIPFGYVIGAIPAGITGIAMSFYEQRKSKYELIPIALYCGILSPLICTLVFILIAGYRDYPSFLNSLFIGSILGLLGGVSAVIVAKIKYKNKPTLNK